MIIQSDYELQNEEMEELDYEFQKSLRKIKYNKFIKCIFLITYSLIWVLKYGILNLYFFEKVLFKEYKIEISSLFIVLCLIGIIIDIVMTCYFKIAIQKFLSIVYKKDTSNYDVWAIKTFAIIISINIILKSLRDNIEEPILLFLNIFFYNNLTCQ